MALLFRYLENKDNLLDPNTSALKKLAIPVAFAALYNASVFFPQSGDTHNNVCEQGPLSRQSKHKFFLTNYLDC